MLTFQMLVCLNCITKDCVQKKIQIQCFFPRYQKYLTSNYWVIASGWVVALNNLLWKEDRAIDLTKCWVKLDQTICRWEGFISQTLYTRHFMNKGACFHAWLVNAAQRDDPMIWSPTSFLVAETFVILWFYISYYSASDLKRLMEVYKLTNDNHCTKLVFFLIILFARVCFLFNCATQAMSIDVNWITHTGTEFLMII